MATFIAKEQESAPVHLGVATVPHDVPFRRIVSERADATSSPIYFEGSASDLCGGRITEGYGSRSRG